MHDELTLPGLVSIEHTFTVPLDHGQPDGEQISVFARELADPDGRDRPLLVYFQGGPGLEAVRPATTPRGPEFIDRALSEFRVLLLDQRGTGRSTPVGHLDGRPAAEQADYLARFRADSIVRDAELIRQELGIERWSVLGQSFGGFCVFTYLSMAPDALREALVTGGVPPLGHSIDEVYAHTYRRVQALFERHLVRYPGDRERLRVLRDHLQNGGVELPTGEKLSWRRFRQFGSVLGMSDGSERLHHLLELDFDSPAFRYDVQAGDPFSRNPLYAVLHEACYCDGGSTRWSAERMLPGAYEDSTLLTGEHVYPWMFEEYAALTPLGEAAEILAARDWPALYAPDVLAANRVPVAAAVYADDMYVERAFSEETAGSVGSMRVWLTSEYGHDGLRADGGRILTHLLELARGRR